MSATEQQTAIHDLVVGDEPLTIEKFAGKSDPGAADVLAMAEQLGVHMVDLKFTDVPGTWQHMTLSISALEEDAFSDGPRLRRLLDPRFSADRRVGHAADARREHREDRPVLLRADAVADLQRDRSDHARGLLARPALRRAEGRAPPRRQRDRRHRLLRARGRVLRLRPRRLRPANAHRLTTKSTTPRPTGTAAPASATRTRSPTSATIRARRRATSRSRRWTRSATCAP